MGGFIGGVAYNNVQKCSTRLFTQLMTNVVRIMLLGAWKFLGGRSSSSVKQMNDAKMKLERNNRD